MNIVAASDESKSESHGGFDNGPTTMNGIRRRILDGKSVPEFMKKSLKYRDRRADSQTDLAAPPTPETRALEYGA